MTEELIRELIEFHDAIDPPLPEKASLYLTGISALAMQSMDETNATSFECSSVLNPKGTDKKYKSVFRMELIE